MTKPYINIKWPGLLVVGKNVTRDQAAEIIVRTCDWPMSSNDKNADKMFNELIATEKEFKKGLQRIKPLNLCYLLNEQITSCNINGPQGWINWDGTVNISGRNIGKWPSVEEVTEEWQTIADAFPFLDLICQVIDNESIDAMENKEFRATAEWIVCDGKVEVKYPQKLIIEQIEDKWNGESFANGWPNSVGATKEQVSRGIELIRRKYA
jgi:hypothetical protein